VGFDKTLHSELVRPSRFIGVGVGIGIGIDSLDAIVRVLICACITMRCRHGKHPLKKNPGDWFGSHDVCAWADLFQSAEPVFFRVPFGSWNTDNAEPADGYQTMMD
jgi:hypothetical protein